MEGEAAGTTDEVARARMVTNLVSFATLMRLAAVNLQPPGFSACDLQTARPRRRRRRGAGAGEEGDRSDGDEGSDEDEWEDDDHLDGIYGDARPGDHSEVQEWDQDPIHDWTTAGWVPQAWVPLADGLPNACPWVKNKLREGAGGAGMAAAEPPNLNSKQALAVDVVEAHAGKLDAYRAAVEAEVSELPPLPEPLRMVLTGTAGTGKTVVINEMVRRIGKDRFELMVPTGCAACGIGGQVCYFHVSIFL